MRWWWLSIEAVAVLSPCFLALVVGTGEPETLWSNLLVITGSQAAATIVVAVLFASRFKAVTQSIGIDSAINVHKVLGVSAVVFTLLHLIAVVADSPSNVWLLDMSQAPVRALTGLSALVVLSLMIVFANKEKRFYERWRWAHRAGALLTVVFITWHIVGVDQLVNTTPWLVFFTALLLSAIALPMSRWRRSTKHKKYIVSDVQSESPTASTLTLTPTKDEPLRFIAGQFVWIRLSRGFWVEDHPFTIASSEYERDVKITFRHLGDWTTSSLTALRPGKTVWVDGPHGAMNLSRVPPGSSVALLGIGVGLTPVMSILRTLAHNNQNKFPIRVLITPTEELFLQELADLEDQFEDLTVFLNIQRPITTQTFTKHFNNPKDWYFLVCGPPALVVHCQETLWELNVPENHILTEQFEIA